MEDEVENVGVAGRRERCTLSYHLSKVECLGYLAYARLSSYTDSLFNHKEGFSTSIARSIRPRW